MPVVVVVLAGASACGGDSSGPLNPAVTAARVVLDVSVSGSIVREGHRLQLTARAYAADGSEIAGKTFAWTALDPAIAPVGPSGLVSAASLGTGRVVAAADGVADTAAISVRLSWAAVATSKWAIFSCGLLSDGRAFCWGDNQAGQLGDGTTTSRTLPTPVAGGLRFRQIAPGMDHTCGITNDGLAYCWGPNPAGELGDGTFQGHAAPALVPMPAPLAGIDAGADFTCALTVAGRPYCWGNNEEMQLGIASSGSGDYHPSPVEVTGAPDLAAISLGVAHACGLTAQGAPYCWGWNEYDQLGNGLAAYSSGPGPVQGGLAFAEIRGGYLASCARTTGGTAYCWGGGNGGRLPGLPEAIPTQVPGGLAIEGLSGGSITWCGLAGGVGYCWASSTLVGTTATTPVAVTPAPPFSQIAPGANHTCAVASDGSAYCWGSNQTGALGIGTTASYSYPVQVHDP
jgi:hypothetical protein